MHQGIIIFCIITAFILATVKVVLSTMEDNDRAQGLDVDPNDYRFWPLLKKTVAGWLPKRKKKIKNKNNDQKYQR